MEYLSEGSITSEQKLAANPVGREWLQDGRDVCTGFKPLIVSIPPDMSLKESITRAQYNKHIL
jgi:hypothetical protein